ncbi:MAG TPA: hypothetical protein VH683_01655 [Thermoleophilaceae bacterium]
MPDVLDRQAAAGTLLEPLAPARKDIAAPGAPPPACAERAIRRTLLDQVARLESELGQVFCTTWPRTEMPRPVVPGRGGGPRLLSLAELEELRDDLAGRISDARRALSDRTWVEEQNRRLIEEMMLAPEQHKWRRVSAEDIGEPGCRHWHVRPRYGFIGMLMGWWRVVISSGCPLAT